MLAILIALLFINTFTLTGMCLLISNNRKQLISLHQQFAANLYAVRERLTAEFRQLADTFAMRAMDLTLHQDMIHKSLATKLSETNESLAKSFTSQHAAIDDVRAASAEQEASATRHLNKLSELYVKYFNLLSEQLTDLSKSSAIHTDTLIKHTTVMTDAVNSVSQITDAIKDSHSHTKEQVASIQRIMLSPKPTQRIPSL